MADSGISPELSDLVFMALDHGIASVQEGGPLIPFVIVENNKKRDLRRFIADRLEDSKAQAESFARACAGESVAIAHDGFLTVPGQPKADAIYVRAWSGQGPIHVFAQRYTPAKFLRKFAQVGNAAYLGTEKSH